MSLIQVIEGRLMVRSHGIVATHSTVAYRDKWVHVTPKEGLIAVALVLNINSITIPSKIIEYTWPDPWLEPENSFNSMRMHMWKLQQKIATIGLTLRTSTAFGYEILRPTDG